ncbi:MAG: hypothetical protein QXL98_02795 [Thermofilaceae archaeon]
MVELKRGIFRRVILDISIDVDEIRMLDESVWKELPFPKQASFPDGRVAYFILAEAGFPYLAYALFSMGEPRDRKEALLLRIRYAFDLIDRLKGGERPLEFHGFAYDIRLILYFGGEVRRCVEWAERLTLEEVKVMLRRLLKLAKQREFEPGLMIDPVLLFHPDDYSIEGLARGCLESLRNLAALLRWLLDERTRDACVLEVSVTRRVGVPDEVLPPWEM